MKLQNKYKEKIKSMKKGEVLPYLLYRIEELEKLFLKKEIRRNKNMVLISISFVFIGVLLIFIVNGY